MSAFAEGANTFAQSIASFSKSVDGFFNDYTGWFVGLIFKSVAIGETSFPIIVGWLLLAAFIFTVYFGFVQFRRVGMAIDIIKGKYTDPNSKEDGEVSHFQALATAVSGTAQHPTSGEINGEFLKINQLDMSDMTNITTSASSSTTGDSIPLAPRLPGATSKGTTTASPLQLIARMARQLDTGSVDSRGRYLVVDPIFIEMLKDEDSRLMNADFGGAGLQNGLVLNNIHGFRMYTSSNLPAVGTGAGTTGTSNQNTNYGVIVAGHDSAVATAEQINKVETYRDPDSFSDIVRGMHLYGRKILRPEAIVTAKYNAA